MKKDVVELIKEKSVPLLTEQDLDPLIEKAGEASVVMLGEASHGTKEYYDWRTLISKRLIEEKGFNFIAVEGDWPECYRVNRFIKNYPGEPDTAEVVLSHFRRWPSWMWANEEVIHLVNWLKEHNAKLENEEQVGFYGLDVYSLWESLETVIKYLKENDPNHLLEAYKAYRCFEPYGGDAQAYAWASRFVNKSCEKEVTKMLSEIRTNVNDYANDPEGFFNIEQNALVAKNAEEYYRTMLQSNSGSWNVRDKHMEQTLQRLMRLHGDGAKAIIWAHNTHIGDAKATDMTSAGMINLGQLGREEFGPEKTCLVGFSSYRGEVIASHAWGAPMQKLTVPPALKGSWEDIFHRADNTNLLLVFNEEDKHNYFLNQERGHRAIGVVYHPEVEQGNYVPTVLARRYDAMIYLDQTTALQPLPVGAEEMKEAPQTYPSSY